jgi:nicotinate-nucleotide pyrophosphorylase (carboxylating)
MSSKHLEALSPAAYREVVRRALEEDVGDGDVTTAGTVTPGTIAGGIFLVKSPLVVAGLAVAAEVFSQVDSRVEFSALRSDGEVCRTGDLLAEVRGPASALLTAERTALNFLQRLCGIATITRRFVEAAGDRISVLDTRKTTPGLRTLEKYAVRAGGGVNHRFGLFDAVLIKDNHVRLAGGVTAALRRMRASRPDMPLEVEAQSLDEVDEALEAGTSRILVDNMSTGEIREAVRRCQGRATVEISGGVTLARMPELAVTGAEYVSIGALTHSAPAADISLELQPA